MVRSDIVERPTTVRRPAWPRYYPVGVTAWVVGLPFAIVLAQIHSGLAFASEQGPMFDVECALLGVLGMGCLVAAFMHSDAAAGRATWILAGAIAFVMLGTEHDLLSPLRNLNDDYVDGLGWGTTAVVLALLTRIERRPPLVASLLALGFLLQSTEIVLDAVDDGPFGMRHAQALGGLEEIIDLVLVVVYCASFFGIAVHARLAAVADEGPAAAIHRRARIARWRRAPVASAADSLRYALRTPAQAAWLTWRNGPVVAARTGRSSWRQLSDQLRLAFVFGIPPSHYYVFELFDDARRADAGDYLLRHETKGFAYAELRGRPITPLTDKLAFARRCEAHGLPVVPVLLAFDRKGQVLSPLLGPPRLPRTDLFVKPNPGKGGRGAQRWDHVGDDRYRSGDGETVGETELLARLQRPPFASGCIVQPRVAPHAALADLTRGALPTVRVVTCRDEHGSVAVAHAVFRMARSSASMVDNFHAGGIAAAVDLASGRLGHATDLGRDATLGWLEDHPGTNAPIAGRTLPHWEEVRDLTRRAHHDAFADRVIIGWDVAILDTGPVLVEGNSSPDLDIVQRIERRPVGGQRVAALLARALTGLDASGDATGPDGRTQRVP